MDKFPSFGEIARRLSLDIDDYLCVEGGTDTDVFQVVSGTLVVERATDQGALRVAELGPGALVGEVSNALGGKRTASVRVHEPAVVRALSQQQFTLWLDQHEEAAGAIATQARMRSNRSRAAAALANLFGLENREIVDAIVDQIQWITLAPGDLLFEQGDVADAAYLLLAGRLSIVAHDGGGNPTLDIEIGRGEIVGEMGILEDAPRSATVRAIREATLAMISKKAFETMTAMYPSLMVKVFMTVIDRLTHRAAPDNRARVVTFMNSTDQMCDVSLKAVVAAVEEFGSTLHLSPNNLHRYVRNVDGAGGKTRTAEFLHEADVAHDYVLLETDRELTDWTVNSIKQSDRFVLFTTAHPTPTEVTRIRAALAPLSPNQRRTAWIVRVHPSSADMPTRSDWFIDDFEIGEVHNVRAGDQRHLARIGRLATGNGRGVVLGGGGAKGFAHVGALRALTEAGLDYDRLGGASMGAVIASFAASGASWSEILATARREFRKDLLDYTMPFVSLFKAEKMAQGVYRTFGSADICDTWIPFFCVTTNITTSELAVHRRGELARAIRASAAIPVALPPVPIDGDLHVDGGVLDNVPVGPMRADPSIGTVIAIDVSPPGGPAADEDFGLSVSGFDVLKRRVLRRNGPALPDIGTTLMSSMLIGSNKAKNDSTTAGLVDLYIDLDLHGVGLLKFENHAAVAQRGYDGARPAIANWIDSRSVAVAR